MDQYIVENYQFWYVTTYSLRDGKLSKQEQKILREKFGDQKLERLINILSESSQEEVNNFISEKMVDAQNQLQREIPKDFKKISNDIKDFDLIYVMDKSNYINSLKLVKSTKDKMKIDLILNTSNPGKNLNVPDPYFIGNEGFENVCNLLNDSCEKIKIKLEKEFNDQR